MADPHVVLIPWVQSTSLIAIGIPFKGGISSPFLNLLSAFSAWARAASRVTVMKAWTTPSFSSILFNADSVISRELISLFLRSRSRSEAL